MVLQINGAYFLPIPPRTRSNCAIESVSPDCKFMRVNATVGDPARILISLRQVTMRLSTNGGIGGSRGCCQSGWITISEPVEAAYVAAGQKSDILEGQPALAACNGD